MGPWGFFELKHPVNRELFSAWEKAGPKTSKNRWHLHDLRLWSLFHLRLLRQVSNLSMASSSPRNRPQIMTRSCQGSICWVETQKYIKKRLYI